MIAVLRTLLVAAAAFSLTACVQVPMSYQPTMQNIQALKSSQMAPVAVGSFALAPGKPADMDKSVSARGSRLLSPVGDSFSQFMKDSLSKELTAAGKLDPASPVVISGLLTDSQLEAPHGTGKGALAARFSVNRGGQTVYDKELRETAEWPSAFVGADAIPTAMNEYTSLFKKLFGKLFGDEEFKKAVAAAP